MGGYGTADAHRLTKAMAPWLQAPLGLRQHPEKPRMTPWRRRGRFLGDDLRGQRNRHGTRWARRRIPPAAERDGKQRVKRRCGYTHMPATDLLMSVNALMRGWTQYYCYASQATPRFGYLTGVACWRTAPYLGRKPRGSITRLMAHPYGVEPRTGKRALYVLVPGAKRLGLWNQPPTPRSILSGKICAQDTRPVMMMSWAGGQSDEQRLDQRAQYGDQCQHCGQRSPSLVVPHPHRLASRPARQQGPARVMQSAQEQQPKWLCSAWHRHHHPGGWQGVATA
jgi:hypothetical protein